MYDLFLRHRVANQLDFIAIVYMMMLVSGTIFINKTFTLVEARYMRLFRNLSNCGRYSWGNCTGHIIHVFGICFHVYLHVAQWIFHYSIGVYLYLLLFSYIYFNLKYSCCNHVGSRVLSYYWQERRVSTGEQRY